MIGCPALLGAAGKLRPRRIVACLIGLGMAIFACAISADTIEPETPEETIQMMTDNVLAYIEWDREGLEKDRARLDALIAEQVLPNFEFKYASRLVLGKHWKTATAEQREAFAVAFAIYLVRVYGDALLQVNRDTLTVLDAVDAPDGVKATVKSRIVMTDGTVVPVDFRMVQIQGYWKIWDVIARGVSYVRTYRADFGVVIANDGIDYLSEFLRTPK